MKPSILHRESTAPKQSTPLVFVHGAFAGAWCWDEHFLPYFQALGYDCYAPNLRGHGAEPNWFQLQLLGIEDYSQDVAWALDQCPQPPVLIGHSMGAFAILRLMQRRRVSLSGLILMSPASPASHFASAVRFLLDFPLSNYKLNLMNASPKYLWPWFMTRDEVRRLMLSSASSPATAERLLPQMQHESFMAMVDMMMASCEPPPKLACPRLVLGGKEDAIVPPEFVRRTAEWIDAELRIVPGLGHSMMAEEGWQVAADSMSEWLAEQCSVVVASSASSRQQ